MTKKWFYSTQRLPIHSMYDVDGEETEDPDEAISFVAKQPDGRWLAGLCDREDISEQGQ